MHYRRRAAVSALAIFLGIGAGCTTTRWDTAAIDADGTTTTSVFGRDAAGVLGSLTAYIGQTPDDLNQWAASGPEATCAAQRIIDRVTTTRLLELGYDPEEPDLALEFSDDERIAAINVLVGCIDFSSGVLSLVSSYQKLSVEESSCVADGIERAGLDRDLAAGIIDGASPDALANNNRFATGLASIAGECLGEESLPPGGPLQPVPSGRDLTPTTTTTLPPVAEDGGEGGGDLDGIVPGGPLDDPAG